MPNPLRSDTMFTAKNLAVGASVVLMATLVYVAIFGMWVGRDLADSESFAESAVAAFEIESSRIAISELAVDKIVEGRPLATLASPLLVDFMSGLLDGSRLEAVLTRVVTQLHAIMFDGAQEGVVVDLTNLGETILPPLETLFPKIAAEIPQDVFTEIVLVEPGTAPELSGYANAAKVLTWIFVLLALALGVVMVVLRQVKWKGFFAIGLGLAIGGFVSLLVVRQSQSIAIGKPSDANVEILVSNLHQEMVGGLRTMSWWILIIGVIVVAASVWYGRSLDTGAIGDDRSSGPDEVVATDTP